MKRAVSCQTEGKFTDLSTVHENLDIARLAAELLTARSLLASPGTLWLELLNMKRECVDCTSAPASSRAQARNERCTS